MRIVNCCPHEIDLRLADGAEVVLPPSGRPARVVVTRTPLAEVRLDGAGAAVPVLESRYGEPVDLPGPEPGTCFVVSYPVAYACPDRADLLIPEDLVRDGRGVVVACRALSRVTTTAGAGGPGGSGARPLP